MFSLSVRLAAPVSIQSDFNGVGGLIEVLGLLSRRVRRRRLFGGSKWWNFREFGVVCWHSNKRVAFETGSAVIRE